MSHPSSAILGHDPSLVAERWQHHATQLAAGAAVAVPDATPIGEHRRTPAAAHIARLATDAGVQAFHFERRAHSPVPPVWVAIDQLEQAEAPVWDAGILPERKYQSFRHDLILASFHPHHRAKWGAHELCHGVVGFGWMPGATPFFHATAGRLAELLPVALWYFFDEAYLRRCDVHQGGGALFRSHCDACERLAAPHPSDATAVDHIRRGLAFVEAELTAIAKTRRLGRPIPHQWATIDLCSDGIAYAHAHHARLSSPAFHSFIERFCVAGGGWSLSLDDLEARVVAVLDALCTGEAAPPVVPSAEHGRWRWIAQDVAWRLLSTAEGPPEPRHAIFDACEAVVAASQRHDGSLRDAIASLTNTVQDASPALRPALCTGYAIPGVAAHWEALADGLESCVPVSHMWLDTAFDDVVKAFSADDGFSREHLAKRFARWLAEHHPGPLADVAALEAAVATLPATVPPPSIGPPRDARRRLADGFVVLHVSHDVLVLTERIDAGELSLDARCAPVVHDGDPIDTCPTALVIGRDASGELVLLDVDPAAADALLALGEGAVPDLEADEQAALEEHGALVPVAVLECVPHPA